MWDSDSDSMDGLDTIIWGRQNVYATVYIKLLQDSWITYSLQVIHH